ncbi:MAG: prolipoprotein diacylglyceryl transferase [Chloroflexota bacterium]
MDAGTLGSVTIGLDPVLARWGPLAIHWYGLLYAAGVALGLRVALPYARERGIPSDDAVAVAWGTGLAALLGGRLYFVAQTRPDWYLAHPTAILATWQGGMAFYGALALGAPTLVVLAHLRHLPVGVLLDAAALLATLGQAIGRIGNLINGDVVGYPSTLPWATIYTNPHAFTRTGIAYDPVAAYEFLFALALFGILWRLRHGTAAGGTLFLLYVVLYAAGQFVLFYRRDNPLVALNLKQAQLTSLAVLAVGTPFLIRRWLRPSRSAPGRGSNPASH